MGQQKRAWPKLLSIWMNAIADAWNMGEAPWAFDERGSLAVRTWSEVFSRTASETDATDAVVELAQTRGVDPRVHRVHAR